MTKLILNTVFLILFAFFNPQITYTQIVKQIKYEGNKKSNEGFLKHISNTKIGQVLDSTLIAKDIVVFNKLNAIAKVDFRVETLDNESIITYIFDENFTLIPFANIYVTSNKSIAYKLGLGEFNLLGRSMILGGFYQHDNYDSYNIYFRAPFLINKNTGLAVSHQNLTTLEPVFFDEGVANYKYNNKSFEISLIKRLNIYNSFELGFNIFTEQYTNKSNLEAPIPEDFKVNKQLYKFQYTFEKIDYNYFYLDGFKSLLNLQYVISNDATLKDFKIIWNDFLYYKKIGAKGNLANRARMGFSSNIKSPFAPFSVDNNINIRGVGNIIDRGTGVIVLNSEYRHTLIEKSWFVMQSNLFVDAGSWRKPGGRLSDFSKAENLRVYPGLGLRFMHKNIYNAIFRIDYGYGITKNASKGFVFGIGQYF